MTTNVKHGSSLPGPVENAFLLKQKSFCNKNLKHLNRAAREIIDRVVSEGLELDNVELKEYLKQNSFREALLREAILSRNNDTVINVLKITTEAASENVENVMQRQLQSQFSMASSSGLDDVDSAPLGRSVYALANAAFIPNMNSARISIQRESEDLTLHAIHLATVRNDHETLKVILEWAKEEEIVGYIVACANKGKLVSQRRKYEDPLQVAILQDYKECVFLLHRFGFEIELHQDDQACIEQMLERTDLIGDGTGFYVNKSFLNSKQFSQKGLRKLDAIERFLRFRAFASPSYIATAYEIAVSQFKKVADQLDPNEEISDEKKEEQKRKLQHLDPIRKCFVCASYAMRLSRYYVQHTDEYKDIADRCQTYAQGLLEQCDDLHEVKILLQCDDIHVKQRNGVYEYALWGGNKKFVSHHYYQQVMYEKMCGEDMNSFDWNNFYLSRKIGHFILIIMMVLFYPIVVTLDLFRGGTILFESPKQYMKKKRERNKKETDEAMENGSLLTNGKKTNRISCQNKDHAHTIKIAENAFFHFFRENMHRPMSRMITHAFLDIFFVLTVILSLIDPQDVVGVKDIQWYDYYCYFGFISYFIDDIVEIFVRKWMFFASLWNIYSLFNNAIFVVSVTIRIYDFFVLSDTLRNELHSSHIVNVGATLYAIAAIMAIIRVSRWLLLLRKIGPVILSIISVLKDVTYFLILLGTIITAFTFGIWFIYDGQLLKEKNFKELYEVDEHVKNPRLLLESLFWRIFDLVEPQMGEAKFKVNNTSYKDLGGTTSEGFSHIVGISLLGIYQISVTIILINILIALMNTSYARITEEADIRWKYSKTFVEHSHLLPNTTMPSPFRYFYYLAKLVYVTCRNTKSAEPSNKHYNKLMIQLVERKDESDREHKAEDQMENLMRDLRNYTDKQVVKRIQELNNRIKEIEGKCGGCNRPWLHRQVKFK